MKVETGCRDCKACTNSGIANAGRGAGRATAAVMTVGLSEVARGFTKNCSVCGHKLSLHQGTDYVQPRSQYPAQQMPQQPIVIVQQVPMPQQAYPPQVYPPQPYAAQQQPQRPAAWHPDPAKRHEFRWWDGLRWTEHVSDRGQTSTDPIQ